MFPILIGLGIITPTPNGPPTPAWVGAGPDGNFVPGTPFYIRAGNFALGMGNVGLLAALFGWAAFGRGSRAFSTTTVMSGRIFFGFFAILFVWASVACAIVGVRKLVRAWRAATR